MRVTVREVADVPMVQLPDPRVKTVDGEPITLGMQLVHAFAPETLCRYEVIHDFAFQNPVSHEWQVLVIGSSLPIVSLDCGNFAAREETWLRFWKKRHRGEQLELP